ncbi:hypothetical protein LXA43DRAFT_982598 [Ganoderma leucocontextum]|nr:hypothetical protein LXA43DRAFT_982598 [Ganoderma leucocontextum]
MSLPKRTQQNSVDGACPSPSVGEVTQVIPRLEVFTEVLPQGHLLTSWQGEASPIPASPTCSTPRELEKQPGDLGALGADVGLLAIADGDESTNVPHTDIKHGQDDEYPETFARVEIINGFYESESDEEDDDEWYQPKGGLTPPTNPKPAGGRPPTIAAVGKPAGPGK